MNATSKSNRTDIQALRGLAVLMVVLYHTRIGGLDAGYLGVDVFFVISGFLITTLVATGIARGNFRLSEFYFRRAKRLLPAAYVTFVVTAIAAPWFLNQQELRDFATQMVGAVTFTGNIVLWQQTGYFEGAGDLKPLLHVWSLAIEEQYYFLLPAALLYTRRSRWLAGVIVVALLSLGLCIAGDIWKPVATFYLLPTRAWELLMGSTGALWALRAQSDRAPMISQGIRLLLVPALICLLLLPFLPVVGQHPGPNAFLVCAATLVVILRNSARLNAALPAKALARIGDFSYSLYLVHWPIIAFMKNAWVGSSPELPLELRVLALMLSLGASYLLYHVVEDPIRRMSLLFSRPLAAKVALSSVLLMSIAPAAMYAMPASADFTDIRRTNYGFSEVCESATPFTPKSECRSSGNPTLLVWGDSFAMHLVPGLVHEWKDGGVLQATQNSCGPFLGLAPRRLIHPGRGTVMDFAWARQCINFNDSVIAYLRTNTSIETVVLSSPYGAYVTTDNFEHVASTGNAFASSSVSAEAAAASLGRTIEAIRALGRKVVLVAPPPSAGFDIGGCLERQIGGKIAFGGRPGCVVDRAQYQATHADVSRLLDSVSAQYNVAVIRFDPWLCDAAACRTYMDGTMIYRDSGHLSYAGSKWLAAHMHLDQLIREQAR